MDIYRQALAILEKKLGAQDPLAIEIRERLSKLSGASEKLREYQILMVRTKKEVEELQIRIEAGENFGELATRHSIDPNASNGGIFQATGSELREELRIELDRLKTGQVSSVFPLAGNWAIVKKISEPAPARK